MTLPLCRTTRWRAGVVAALADGTSVNASPPAATRTVAPTARWRRRRRLFGNGIDVPPLAMDPWTARHLGRTAGPRTVRGPPHTRAAYRNCSHTFLYPGGCDQC